MLEAVRQVAAVAPQNSNPDLPSVWQYCGTRIKGRITLLGKAFRKRNAGAWLDSNQPLAAFAMQLLADLQEKRLMLAQMYGDTPGVRFPIEVQRRIFQFSTMKEEYFNATEAPKHFPSSTTHSEPTLQES